MDGGDRIAEVLRRHGVQFLFTLCGGHISPILVGAKRRGIRVVDVRHEVNTVFAAPEVYERLKGFAQMNPPIRDKRHQAGLWRAVREGIADVLGTDHAPHTREEKAKPSPWRDIDGGAHGFDPYDPLMRAVFVAHGPSFRPGVVLPVFENVDVYPLLAKVTGVKAEKSDGSLKIVGRALR